MYVITWVNMPKKSYKKYFNCLLITLQFSCRFFGKSLINAVRLILSDRGVWLSTHWLIMMIVAIWVCDSEEWLILKFKTGSLRQRGRPFIKVTIFGGKKSSKSSTEPYIQINKSRVNVWQGVRGQKSLKNILHDKWTFP